MSDRDVTDEDKNDSETSSYDKRVASAARLIGNSLARLEHIIANYHEPPEPEKVALRGALTELKAKAEAAISQANRLYDIASR